MTTCYSLFISYLEISEKRRFSDVFRGYKKEALGSNIWTHLFSVIPFLCFPFCGKCYRILESIEIKRDTLCEIFQRGFILLVPLWSSDNAMKGMSPIFISPAVTWSLRCIFSLEFTGYCYFCLLFSTAFTLVARIDIGYCKSSCRILERF